METIESTLQLIKEQIGKDLVLDDYFSGVHIHDGKKYFNVLLKTKISESLEFQNLQQFATQYKSIAVEGNGVNRVAIFF